MTVIPAMDHIDKKLSTYSCDKKYLPSIHSAVTLAKKTLDCYYSLTDYSEVYQIAMGRCYNQLHFNGTNLTLLVLHSCHKLAYFKATDWPDEWINTAKDLVTTKFECTYLNHNESDDARSDDAMGGERELEAVEKVHIHQHLLLLPGTLTQYTSLRPATCLMISLCWPL